MPSVLDLQGRKGHEIAIRQCVCVEQHRASILVGVQTRCSWAGEDPLMIAYHDREWGVPLHDDRGLFEFLILEGAQAGLSWSTILSKRHAYRAAFDGFQPRKVARYGEEK